MTIKQFLQQWGFSVASTILLTIAVILVGINSCHVDSYRQNSETHTFTIHMSDNSSWQDVDEIVRSVEGMTHQRVYNELVDEQNKVYRLKVKCPPQDSNSLWNWFTQHRGVEKVDIQ